MTDGLAAGRRRPQHPLRIALVNMPWARVEAPSIQCGLLKAELLTDGHQVDVHYLNMDLAALLGAELYATISGLDSERVHLLGEWLFTAAAFGTEAGRQGYLDAFPQLGEAAGQTGAGLADLCLLRDETLPHWIEAQAARDIWASYDLVGLTSTFEQNVAALALAAALKRAHPQMQVVLGGANFEGEMGQELFRVADWIDFAVIGEGDVALPELAAALADGRSPTGLPGVCTRAPDGAVLVTPPAAQVKNMDTLPVPDYGDYFTTLDRLGRAAVLGDRPVRLLVEFSRGCWWGEKHHCTFCGLNALGMSFRSKSPPRASSELIELAARHRVLQIDAVDNIIDMRYLRTLSADLSKLELDLSIFFEVKANLDREQLAALRRAGVTRIQPGLESLSTNILGLMRKGTTMLLNVRLLKWAQYYDIGVTWNMLMGFPGESDGDYSGQAELLPTLYHLQPPGGCTKLWLERFSPYFTDPELGVRDREPRRAYQFIYPIKGIDLRKVAYFFDYTHEKGASGAAHSALEAATAQWRKLWQAGTPELSYLRGPGYIQLYDSRGGHVREATITGWRADAFQLCGDTARTAGRVAEELGRHDHQVPPAKVAVFLDECVANRLAVAESGRYLTVALPRQRTA